MNQIIFNKLLNHSCITYYEDAFKTKLAKVIILKYFQSFESQSLKCEEALSQEACFKTSAICAYKINLTTIPIISMPR